MRDALICGAVRTAVGGLGGALRPVTAEELAGRVISHLLDRCSLPGDQVEDVIFGQCYPNGENPAIGRLAALRAGLPVEVPGFQLDRRCVSGLQGVCLAAMEVQTGAADVILAGGVESMSNAEFYTLDMRWGKRGHTTLYDRLDRGRVTAGCESRYPVEGGMLETAENLRRQYSIPREEQDEYALRSHQRAVAAWDEGRFQDHIVPIPVPQRRGDDIIFERDEHPRADTSLEKLARLNPVRAKQDPEATVTAGNASGENDAAAVCVVASPEAAARLGLEPMAVFRGWAAAGVHPAYMGIGPVPATQKVLDRLGLSLADIDLIELNEAFAAQVLAVTREWKFTSSDFERMNVNGSGISIGHPVGATGVRILADMLPEMKRRNARYALETMCIGGGQGIAAVFERAS
ncbi:MAG TPA: acetyl-CoA C-acetyltransferase [Tepidiformaceae bacterium]|nr:acetyl-CoA C-acetyltransferase [Tepidiformaceae bacterium]